MFPYLLSFDDTVDPLEEEIADAEDMSDYTLLDAKNMSMTTMQSFVIDDVGLPQCDCGDNGYENFAGTLFASVDNKAYTIGCFYRALLLIDAMLDLDKSVLRSEILPLIVANGKHCRVGIEGSLNFHRNEFRRSIWQGYITCSVL